MSAGNAADYRAHVVLLIVLLVASVIVPMLFYAPQLVRARREGLRKFEPLADGYVEAFETKWLEGASPSQQTPRGSADLHSLADLARSNEIVREMRPVPFDLRMLMFLVLVLSVPFFPLALTVVPLAELIKDVLEMLL